MKNLAEYKADLSTMRLGRLDKALAPVRHRLDSIYRGRAESTSRPGLTVARRV